MSVHFIGAGPGAPDLITVRGLRLIRRCPVVLYAGSLVPAEVVAQAGDEAPVAPRVVDTAPLDLDAITAEIERAHGQGFEVARVHSGDPSFYGAIAEQARRLRALGIGYDVTPGVPAFAAAAADGVIRSYAIVQDDATLRVQGKDIRLFGVYVPRTERGCTTILRPPRCGSRRCSRPTSPPGPTLTSCFAPGPPAS